MWVFKVKKYVDGSIEHYTTLLVVKCYTQKVGICYTETFSPIVKSIVKLTTICVLVATAVKKGWDMTELHVNNAFLHGNLDEDVYMKIPPELIVHI